MAIKPNALLDTILTENGLKNDAALGRVIGVPAPVLSKVRNGILPVGATLIIRLHESFPIEVKRIKELAGIPSLQRYVAPEPEAQPEAEAATA
jgi:hypothetical protein